VSNYFLRYAVIGQDTEFSFSPVDLGADGFILCDALYDLHGSTLEREFVLLAMPKAFAEYQKTGWGEYWNSKTGLLVEFQPGEKGYQPDEDFWTPERRAELAAQEAVELAAEIAAQGTYEDDARPSSCEGADFSLDRVIKFVGHNRPAVLVTDCELYWSANREDDVLSWDDRQMRAFKLVEIDIEEAREFFQR